MYISREYINSNYCDNITNNCIMTIFTISYPVSVSSHPTQSVNSPSASNLLSKIGWGVNVHHRLESYFLAFFHVLCQGILAYFFHLPQIKWTTLQSFIIVWVLVFGDMDKMVTIVKMWEIISHHEIIYISNFISHCYIMCNCW